MKEVKGVSVQFNVKPGDIDANLAYVSGALRRGSDAGAELAVLPEMWSTGFSYKNLVGLAMRTEEINAALLELSRELRMVIAGSVPESSGEKVFNTAYLFDNGRLAGQYRKMHLFSLLGEERAFLPGESRLVAETSIGKIGVMICYDLRFPELSRRLAIEGAEIICIPAQWPSPREEHWRTLLRARAIENQLFIMACNACGAAGKLDLFGMSMIIDPKGDILAEAGAGESEIYATLKPEIMAEWRSKIPCLNDRRPELY